MFRRLGHSSTDHGSSKGQRTIRIESSREMMPAILSHVMEALVPVGEKTGLGASFEFEDSPSSRTALRVALPDSSWQIPLLEGFVSAILERQELVSISGLDPAFHRIFLSPWFINADAPELPRPKTWSYNPTTTLASVAKRPDINRLLCSWITVSNVVRAVTLAFSGRSEELTSITISNPSVPERVPYQVYAKFASAWCKGVQIPSHLLVGVELLMGDRWNAAMRDWCLKVRPQLDFEIFAESGKHRCRITAFQPTIALLESALLCIGNWTISVAHHHLRWLIIMPEMHNKLRVHNSTPDPALHSIVAAVMEEIGIKSSPVLQVDSSKPELCFVQRGEPYFTIRGPMPMSAGALRSLWEAARKAHEILYRRNTALRDVVSKAFNEAAKEIHAED